MLIRFNIKNFLSFSSREEGQSEEFSMISGKVRNKKSHIIDDGKVRILKFAAVYGANASGKSNLVKALDFMKHTVETGLPEGYTEKYCKTEEENRNQPSYFEIEIKLHDRYYAYGFEVLLSQGKFLSEWLTELTADNKEKCIFERDIQECSYKLGSSLSEKGLTEKLNVYAEDIVDDGSVLFLSVMNRNKKNLYERYGRAAVIRDVYLWMTESLDINYPDEEISSYSYLANTENMEEICKMVAAFGTGITGFEMVDAPLEKVVSHLPAAVKENLLKDIEDSLADMDGGFRRLRKGIIMRSHRDFFVLKMEDYALTCQTIQFSHNKNQALFELSEESDGTIRVLDLLEILLSGEGKTYVIDELDRCLHPSLTYKFVEVFLQMAARKKIQLIVTTHESRLLDFDLLRRDEVWFVDKRKSGESDIYSLEEYNARFDQKIDKAYLEGRYGGVPIFNTIFPVKEI